MTKAELILQISTGTGDSKADVERILDELGSVASAELKKGGEVPLPGLGKLKVVDQAARTGRNPATGEAVEIAAKRKPKFAPISELKKFLN